MLQYLSKKIRNRKGFTLVELIVVIAILGILAGIAVPKMGSFRTDAAEKTHKANVRTLESAATMMLAENGTGTSTTWTKTTGKTGDTGWDNYLQAWPDNPIKGGESYKVVIEADGDIKVTPKADYKGNTDDTDDTDDSGSGE